MISVGPFELIVPIASGGMGEVWRGIHSEQSVPVAIKVLTRAASRDDHAVQSFRNEMRALAGLNHDAIVHLFDHGAIDAAAADASDGRLLNGSPYFVMELASGGALTTDNAPTHWSALTDLLFTVLDALAHAHARGVIHRDLKPSNLLCCGPDDLRPGLKLTDFGIAHLVQHRPSSAGNLDEVAGTLHYMAPEQLHGAWRDYGPWTDLYALGCMAYQLAAGHQPFAGYERNRLLVAHLRKQPPPLQPTFEVPPGFAGWVTRLMAKAPNDRFSCTADAARALAVLGSLDDEDTESSSLAPGASTITQGRGETTRLFLPEGKGPTLPRSWRRKQDRRLSLQMVGAGLRLYGLRTVPMVDREPERDAIWKALLRVHRTQKAQAVIVRGPAGTGKSRLVDWMCERALELGGATLLCARHQALGAPGSSLHRMVESYLCSARLERDRVEQRVTDALGRLGGVDQDLVFTLTEYLCPLDPDHNPFDPDDEPTEVHTTTTTRMVRLQTAEERQALLVRLVERVAAQRPLILLLEDVQWGYHALSLAADLLYTDVPILLLLTARDEELVARPSEDALLREISGSGRSTTLQLGPLGTDDHHALVGQLLSLEASLAAQVAERTAGNPLFAVELVGDWVQRGLLEVGPDGFVLRSGLHPELPDDLHAVWEMRIRRAVEGLHPDAHTYLERAAALGQEVDEEEWMEVCDDPEGRFADTHGVGSGGLVFSPRGARIRSKLVDRMIRARLASETSLGWAFTHQMVRESLERGARESGSWGAHNQACAHMLRRRAARNQRGVTERLGKHLVAGGKLQEAIEPLLRGVDERCATVGYRPALGLLGSCEQVMVELALADTNPRWGELWVLRSRLCFQRSDYEMARRWAEKALVESRRYGWAEVERSALFQRAQVWLRRTKLDQAEADLQAMRDTLGDAYDPATTARALFGLAAVARYRHTYDDAYHLYGEACRNFTAASQPEGAASCWRDMAALELIFDNPSRAEGLYRRALDVFERLGVRREMANCVNGFAEVARTMGDLPGAEQGYRRALELYEQIGGGQTLVPRLNLGLIRLEQRQFELAQHDFELARRDSDLRGRKHFQAAAHVGLLACAAGLHDWSRWEVHLKQAIPLLQQTGFADPDTARVASTAGDLAFAAGKRKQASQGYRLAQAQYRALDDAEHLVEVAKRLLVCGAKG